MSSLHLSLFLGLIPLKYSRISVLSAPHAKLDLVMLTQGGMGKGVRLSIRTESYLTATFTTFKAVGSPNDSFSNSGFMARTDLPCNCYDLW